MACGGGRSGEPSVAGATRRTRACVRAFLCATGLKVQFRSWQLNKSRCGMNRARAVREEYIYLVIPPPQVRWARGTGFVTRQCQLRMCDVECHVRCWCQGCEERWVTYSMYIVVRDVRNIGVMSGVCRC